MRQRLGRHRLLLLALGCAALSAVFVLLAIDAAAWGSTVARDDMKFRAQPTHASLWKPSTWLPGDPAGLLVGTSSTIAWRRALQYFWYSRIGSDPDLRLDAPTLRATAQDRLLTEISSAPTAAQRSTAANLLGVLVVTTPSIANDPSAITQTLTRSAEYFQQAIAIDPSNNDAKENLELVLRLTKPGKGKVGNDARSGYGFGKGQGIGNQGGGY